MYIHKYYVGCDVIYFIFCFTCNITLYTNAHIFNFPPAKTKAHVVFMYSIHGEWRIRRKKLVVCVCKTIISVCYAIVIIKRERKKKWFGLLKK